MANNLGMLFVVNEYSMSIRGFAKIIRKIRIENFVKFHLNITKLTEFLVTSSLHANKREVFVQQ